MGGPGAGGAAPCDSQGGSPEEEGGLDEECQSRRVAKGLRIPLGQLSGDFESTTLPGTAPPPHLRSPLLCGSTPT